jgi:xyloglucan fucosyltransferase
MEAASTAILQAAALNKRALGVDHTRISSGRNIVSIRSSTLWKSVVFGTVLIWLLLLWIKVMNPSAVDPAVSAAAARHIDHQPIHVFDITVGLADSIMTSASRPDHLLHEARIKPAVTADDHAAATAVNLAVAKTSTKLPRLRAAADESRGANIATSLDPPAAEAAVQMDNGGSVANSSTTKPASVHAVQMQDDAGSAANSSTKLPAAVVQIHNDPGANGKLPAADVVLVGSVDQMPAAAGAAAMDHKMQDNSSENRSRKQDVKSSTGADHSSSTTTKQQLPASVEGLIKDIRAAAVRANGGKAVQPLSDAAKREWHERNPCNSREKLPRIYSRRKFAKDVEANPAWELIFREYTILHRTCTTRIGDLAQYFRDRNTSTGCKFMMCDPTPGSGLGNKILLTTSCFLYAVLTQRVLLVPSGSLLCDVMCEPFEGSTWKLAHPILLGLGPGSAFFESVDNVFLESSATIAGSGEDDEEESQQLLHSSSSNNVEIYATDVSDFTQFQPHNRFYCPTEQRFLSNVTCVGLVGCQYLIPKLFSIPIFRPTLEALFPTRMVLTHLLRSLMLPTDIVWRSVENVEAMQPDHADRRLGVQIRYFRGPESFHRLHDGMEYRIKQCTLDNGLLPKQGAPPPPPPRPQAVVNTTSASTTTTTTNQTSSTARSKHRQPKNIADRSLQSSSTSSRDSSTAATTKTTTETAPFRTTVFIASLYDSFEKSLTLDYLRNPPANGEKVTVVQLTQKFQQGWTVEEDAQALVEIILLSFSDDIIVTPMSTFGGVAHAYGALVPWFVQTPPWFVDHPEDYGEPTGPPCIRGQTIDTCQHVPPKKFECRHDPQFNDISVVGLAPYLQECLVEDVATGIQLITATDS